jgi:mono/diheme cytochrome c family protein
MNPPTRYAILAICVLMGACNSVPQGDPARGEQLHDACLGCHGTELYVPPAAKVRTLSDLKKAVDEWNDRMNPKLTDQEVADVTAYLNAEFYKLK